MICMFINDLKYSKVLQKEPIEEGVNCIYSQWCVKNSFIFFSLVDLNNIIDGLWKSIFLKFVFSVCIQYPDKWHRKECFKSWSSQVKVHQYKLLDHLHNLGPLCRRAAGWTFSRCLNMVKHKHKHDMIVSDNLNKSYKYIGTGLLKKRLYKEFNSFVAFQQFPVN